MLVLKMFLKDIASGAKELASILLSYLILAKNHKNNLK